MNQFANTPVFLGLTGDMDEKTTRQLALHALVVTFIIVVAFGVTGSFLFHFSGITLYAFKIAGGLLVGLVGY